ncbi:type II restriction endonuclease [Bacillus inaquosorum]|uniref:type II restriction endonuclease n=2 Tax=Bacillus inaquosorum TaxID=483913 RepID=UPI002DDCBA72|nr:type II restriction endonuclease [Bacillus inaquosorum]
MMYKFIDLFAGIGGIRIAFEAQGAECVFSSEWDAKAQETYLANFGEKPHGDITEISSNEIPDHDILLAGFPCQPFSLAGVSKKNALGRQHGFADEAQGTLFFEIARIIRDKKPKAFLLENVKNLRSHDEYRTFRTIMRVLQKELGYKVYDSIIDAKSVVPQHRERIYIVGFREQLDFKFPEFPSNTPAISTILEENVDEKYTLTDNLWKYLQDYAAKHKKAGNGFGYGLVDLNSSSRTLSARYYKDGAEILIPQPGKNPRRLTPKECSRLQGFPEDFKIVVSDTAAYKQFGNTVAVPVVKKIAEQMIKSLKEHKIVEGYDRSKYHYRDIRDEVIARASQYGEFFCKYISANDTGKTGGHQSGFYIPKHAHKILFDDPGIKGENKEREIRLYWEQLDYHTDTMFKWYGKGSRSEYRMTRFGKNFPFFKDEHIGDLLVIIKVTKDEYLGYVLSGNDAEAFLGTFSISPVENASTHIQMMSEKSFDEHTMKLVGECASKFKQFPNPRNIATKSREIYYKVHKDKKPVLESFDAAILDWFNIEYQLFQLLENNLYKKKVDKPFSDLNELLKFANTVTESRRRRIINSFQFHLEYIFNSIGLSYKSSRKNNNERDVNFAFFNNEGQPFMFLSAHTTCKDSWKSAINLISSMEENYLITLEKGLSEITLKQIYENNIKLIVPEKYRSFYPKQYRDKLLNIANFCSLVLDNYSKNCNTEDLFNSITK